MAARTKGENDFEGVRARLLLRNKAIGIMTFTNEPPPRQLVGIGNMTEMSSDLAIPSAPVSNFTGDQGIFVDPFDSRRKITWEYDGVSVSAREVFTAMIDTLASLAPYDVNERFEYATGWSSSEQLVLSVVRKSGYELAYGRVSECLVTIMSHVIARLKNFGEMNIQIWYGEDEVGSAVLFKPQRLAGGNGTQEAATS